MEETEPSVEDDPVEPLREDTENEHVVLVNGRPHWKSDGVLITRRDLRAARHKRKKPAHKAQARKGKKKSSKRR